MHIIYNLILLNNKFMPEDEIEIRCRTEYINSNPIMIEHIKVLHRIQKSLEKASNLSEK